MVNGDSSHISLAVLFLYITSGIYCCPFSKMFIVFFYIFDLPFSKLPLLLNVANRGLSVFSFIVELTLFRILHVGNYFANMDLQISLKYATTFVRKDQFKDELFYSNSPRRTWENLPPLAQG
jgi:hypothetical protein